MRYLPFLAPICLAGCANGFEKFYTPQPNVEKITSSPYVSKAPAQPKLYAHSADIGADYKKHVGEWVPPNWHGLVLRPGQ